MRSKIDSNKSQLFGAVSASMLRFCNLDYVRTVNVDIMYVSLGPS